MLTVGSYEAKTRLPELLRRVGKGERVTITRHGHPIAVIIPAGSASGHSAADAVSELEAFGEGRSLGRKLNVFDLIQEGRR
jgi:prevent-host-death family protein